MKVDFREIYESQETFETINNNQLEILESLRHGILSVITLESFRGTSANNIKAYLNETHREVLESLEVILNEMDTRFYNLVTDFVDSVDNGYTPILSTEFVEEVSSKMDTLKSGFETVDKLLEEAILSVSDIYTPPIESKATAVRSGYDACIEKADAVKNSLINYNTEHAADMENINATLDLLQAVFVSMRNSHPAGMENYVPDSTGGNNEDFLKLAELRIQSATYMANHMDFLTDQTIGFLNSLGIPLGLLSGISGGVEDLSDGLRYNDILKLYSYGMRYELCETDGKIFYRMISDIDNVADLQKYLVDLGFPNLKYSKIVEMTTDGVPLMNTETGNMMNKKIIQAMENIDGFATVADDITGTGKVSKVTKVIKVLDVVGKIADGVGYFLMGGISAYENIYNPRTGEWELTSGDKVKEAITDTAVDIALDVGVSAAGAWAGAKGGAALGAAIGSIFPGPGTVIGGAVGGIVGAIAGAVGSSLLVGSFKFGEPPKSVTDYVKDGVDAITDEVGKFFSKVFW